MLSSRDYLDSKNNALKGALTAVNNLLNENKKIEKNQEEIAENQKKIIENLQKIDSDVRRVMWELCRLYRHAERKNYITLKNQLLTIILFIKDQGILPEDCVFGDRSAAYFIKKSKYNSVHFQLLSANTLYRHYLKNHYYTVYSGFGVVQQAFANFDQEPSLNNTGSVSLEKRPTDRMQERNYRSISLLLPITFAIGVAFLVVMLLAPISGLLMLPFPIMIAPTLLLILAIPTIEKMWMRRGIAAEIAQYETDHRREKVIVDNIFFTAHKAKPNPFKNALKPLLKLMQSFDNFTEHYNSRHDRHLVAATRIPSIFRHFSNGVVYTLFSPIVAIATLSPLTGLAQGLKGLENIFRAAVEIVILPALWIKDLTRFIKTLDMTYMTKESFGPIDVAKHSGKVAQQIKQMPSTDKKLNKYFRSTLNLHESCKDHFNSKTIQPAIKHLTKEDEKKAWQKAKQMFFNYNNDPTIALAEPYEALNDYVAQVYNKQ